MILCLGVSNSGKTYTATGESKENQGLLQRLIYNLLAMKLKFLEKKEKNNEFFVRKEEIEEIIINSELYSFEDFALSLEAFEVFNEEIIDLSSEEYYKSSKPQLGEIHKKIFIQSFFFVDFILNNC